MQLASSAGPSLLFTSNSGTFQATIAPTTPIGSRWTIVRTVHHGVVENQQRPRRYHVVYQGHTLGLPSAKPCRRNWPGSSPLHTLTFFD
ncbi:hypothetical protein [Mycobacterium riyadhense]|uniref:hypothetical protein n=1 Tax=Mycobacterium riyadhense TaxID=486698 RepID=UPI00268EE8F8